MKTLYAMFAAAFGLPNSEPEDTSRLVPRDPPGQFPLDPSEDEGRESTRPVVLDLGEAPGDVLAGSIVHDLRA